ncbi:hypothetical protein NDA11_002384 [Ustilago hordei]|nr:hypothetical protein NDA11_002384 [Ustilago hordei]KAJ1595336.1 hypothetical protein NDA14_002000 [Ustilago hordei]
MATFMYYSWGRCYGNAYEFHMQTAYARPRFIDISIEPGESRWNADASSTATLLIKCRAKREVCERESGMNLGPAHLKATRWDSASDSIQASNALAKAFSLANSDSASLSRSPSKKMHVRGRSSRQQPWWLFVIALSYVLILTFSSAAPTGRALQQSNPELSAVKNVHPEVYQNLAKARLRKRGNPQEYMTVRYPGEKLIITRQNGVYMFNYLNSERSSVMQARKWSELPTWTKSKFHFLEGPAPNDDPRPSRNGIVITPNPLTYEDTYKDTYEDPMLPKQRIVVWRHDNGRLEFGYHQADGIIRRVPSHKLPQQIQSHIEKVPELKQLLENTASSSRVFHPRK